MKPYEAPKTVDALRGGGKAAIARLLSALEQDADAHALLLDSAYNSPKGRVIGLTGPPGVGKSSLIQSMIGGFRAKSETVAVLAVDPTSQRTGGALLGDRTRLKSDPEDDGIFVRSMAAGNRLGGLSDAAFAAAIVLRATFDWVIVESVGVGQSESDVAHLADIAVLCIQPGSGDSLQFMKAGIMEIPDIILVTKADFGAAAKRTVADVEGALSLGASGRAPVIAISSSTGTGISEFLETLSRKPAASPIRRDEMTDMWMKSVIARSFGAFGLHLVADSNFNTLDKQPFQSDVERRRSLLKTLMGRSHL